MSWLIDNFRLFNKKKAVSDYQKEYKYSDIIKQIDEYSNLLNRYILQGDVVAIVSDYNFYSIALFLALLKKKCIIVPIVSKITKDIKQKAKIAHVKKTININLKGKLSINEFNVNHENKLVTKLFKQGNAGLILFSSGSTGQPKAMIHNLDNFIESFKGRKSRNLNILVFLLFDHIGGLNTLLNALSIGSHLILPRDRNASSIATLIEKHKINILPTSPTFLNMMLMENVADKFNLSSLKLITYGTEQMQKSLLIRLKKVFPKTRLLQTFGSSETGIAQTESLSSDSLKIRIKDPNQKLKIVNGELWLKSKTQILGYLNADMDNFTQDGWFKTGDIVEKSKDGYISIVGRKKEIINVGGEKVYPTEVESLVLEIPEIKDCIAYPVKNIITGQSVGIKVVLKKNLDVSSVKTIVRNYCKNKIQNYKIPTKIEVVGEIKFTERFKKNRKTNANFKI